MSPLFARDRSADIPGGGRCPLCGALLGVGPERDAKTNNYLPPSLRLEVAGDFRRRDQLAWRLSVVHRNESRTSSNPFVEDDIRCVYLLCGDGHYFLEWLKLPGDHGRSVWRDQSFVAAVGPVASGKSYLITRTLNQPLTPLNYVSAAAEGLTRVELIGLTDPLESVPKDVLDRLYAETKRPRVHRPIPATAVAELIPHKILQEYIGDGIPEAAEDLQKKVMKRARAASDRWGFTIRQPIFVRTRTNGRLGLTCVADLAGELFNKELSDFSGAPDLSLLRNCGTVVWVIDPFHSEGTMEEFLLDALGDDTMYQRIAEGSSRPDEARAGDPNRLREVIELRDAVNDRLADVITRDESSMFGSIGGVLHNLVVVTKADLLERALQKCSLRDLGEPDSVVEGVATYLQYVTDRHHPVAASPAVAEMVDYLHVGGMHGADQERAGQQRIAQLAAALVDHYSDHDRFWNLVHQGRADGVELHNPEGLSALDTRAVAVPSLDDHLVACLYPGGGRELQMRDLVLSALACGVLCGLGHRRHVVELFQQRWREVRFFLCSPLGTVPTFEPSPVTGEVRMQPSSRGFPKVSAASAALTQLKLRILHEAMP